MAIIAAATLSSGCVKRMAAVNEPARGEAAAFAALRSVTVSADASRIVLTSDRPLTYTSYKAGAPAKIVIDISQTEPGGVATPVEVNRGNIRRIDILRQAVGGGVLTRVEIALTRDVDFSAATDPADHRKLIVTLVPLENEARAGRQARELPAAEAKEPPLVEGRIEEKTLAPEPQRPAHDQAAPLPAAAAHAGSATALAGAARESGKEAAAGGPAGSGQTAAAGPRVNALMKTADGIELSIEGGVPQTFNSFKLKKPDRIVLDLFGMKNAIDRKVVPIGAFGVADARVGATPDKVRIVLDAQGETLPPYEVVKTDLGLKIRLAKETPARPAAQLVTVAAAPAPKAEAPAAPAAPAPAAARPLPPVPPPAAVKSEVQPRWEKGSIESIDFKIVDGVSRLALKLHGSCQPSPAVRGPQGISLTVKECQIPKNLQRSLDTSKFGSPVLSVTPYQVRIKGRPVAKLLVRLRGNPRYSFATRGDLFVLDVVNPAPLPTPKLPPPAVPRAARAHRKIAAPEMAEELAATQPQEQAVTELPSQQSAAPKKLYTGRRVTLEFSDADIRKIFQLIAEVSNLNFLISDDVTGTISLKLVNVPWDQALDVILDSKGLGMQREGNIVQIKPKARIQTQAEEEVAARKAAERTLPLHTAIFDVNYAAVGEVAGQFQALKSERGTIIRDERTNRVIVTDIQPALNAMRQLLKNLDAPEKQVMIEARIVEATSSFTRDLGVQWGLHYRDGSASVMGINSFDSSFGGIVSSGPAATGSTVGGIGAGMSFGKLNSNIQIDMRLSAAATIGEVKIISTPKVVTLNNKAAKISQGQSIPYQTTSAEGTKTEFVEAALTLEVTPHITADGSVSMKIKASNNSPGVGSPPPINKKEATTELVVANGETTVIGGIYVDSDTESDTGIPFLSDIPLLGWLFKSNSKQKTKTELLIFITPKVVI